MRPLYETFKRSCVKANDLHSIDRLGTNKQRRMNNFKEGFVGAIFGIIGAIVFSAILSSLAQDKTIPHDYIWIFTAIGIASTISTFFIFKTAGFLFNIGWIIGAWLLKDAMDTGTFLVFFVAPIIILIIRIVLLFKSSDS